MREKRINEMKGIIVLSLGLILLVSLVSFTPYDLAFYTSHPNVPPKNLIRGFGAYLAGIIFFLIGWSGYIIPIFIIWLAIRLFRGKEFDFRLPQLLGMAVLLLSLSSLFSLIGNQSEHLRSLRAGVLGWALANFVNNYFGKIGSFIIFITFTLLSFILVSEVLISTFISRIIQRIEWFLKRNFYFAKSVFGDRRKKDIVIAPKTALKKENELKPSNVLEKPPLRPRPELSLKPIDIKIETKVKQETLLVKAKPAPLKIGDYQLPPLDLLDSPPPLEERQIKEDLVSNARILEETLADFGISAKVTDIERGPVITRYELEPAAGVKLQRIVSLSDDVALTMKAQSVRIVAPIPGKGRVGVEVPNMQSSLVYLKEILASKEFQGSGSRLTLALGKDITGRPVISDLGQMPHLLIAGTTGSGKTVCVNSLILSLLFRALPDEIKFLMVDPKMVELAPFNGLPHLICPVLTDIKKVASALNWVVNEMEERYRIFAKLGVRNIEAYNEKQEKLPYIVVIIDELADLMVIARDHIESAITRLAQLSRAVGIHLILATQRPSVDVVTGVIKANFPARISFRVASKVDSRTVLDMNGADKLLGKGDFLFLKPGDSRPIRAQGSLVSDKEIDKVVNFIREQAEPVYDEEILQEKSKALLLEDDKDELYDEAIRVIMESGQASSSILQRRLRLGYTRAARIIDMMEQEGLVGPYEGSKPRRILVDREVWLKERIIR
jgi:S-DNA-T family DNA segregation ATPase FtsK/SpoIIIE